MSKVVCVKPSVSERRWWWCHPLPVRNNLLILKDDLFSFICPILGFPVFSTKCFRCRWIKKTGKVWGMLMVP